MGCSFRVVVFIVCLHPALSKSQAHIHSFLTGFPPVAQTHNLKGPVKQITQTQSPITNKKTDWFDGHSRQNYTEEYNKQGFLQKRISRDDSNRPQRITHCEYNAEGRISSVWEEGLLSAPVWERNEGRIDYEFDPAKKVYIVRDKRVIMGKPHNVRMETSVDSTSRISVQREYKQDTLLVREQRYTWDAQGYITKQTSRYRKQSDDSFQSDTAGFEHFLKNELQLNLSETEKKLMDKSLDSSIRKEDSLQKNQPEWTGDTITYLNQYNSQLRLIRQEFRLQSQFTSVVSFSYTPEVTRVVRQDYDKRGDLVSETIRLQHPIDKYILSDSSRHRIGDKWETTNYNYANVPKLTYQYQYDDYGNWIVQKQVDMNGKQIGAALMRQIEYYP